MKGAVKFFVLFLAFLMAAASAVGCKRLEFPDTLPSSWPTLDPDETSGMTEAPAKATEAPTAEPTDEPTAAPTDAPTAEPTEEPTPEPTAPPSDNNFTNPDVSDGFDIPTDGSFTMLDLDGDRIADTFWVTRENAPDSGETRAAWHIILGNDPRKTHEGSVYGSLKRCMAVDTKLDDNRIEIVMEFLDLQAEEQGFIGSLRVSDSGKSVQYFQMDGSLMLRSNGGYFKDEKLKILSSFDFFGEYEGYAYYRIRSYGFKRVTNVRFSTGGPSLLTVDDIPAFQVVSDGVPGDEVIIPSGEYIYPQYSDASSFIVVKLHGGSLAYIKIAIDPDRQIAVIDGRYYFEYFDADH